MSIPIKTRLVIERMFTRGTKVLAHSQITEDLLFGILPESTEVSNLFRLRQLLVPESIEVSNLLRFRQLEDLIGYDQWIFQLAISSYWLVVSFPFLLPMFLHRCAHTSSHSGSPIG